MDDLISRSALIEKLEEIKSDITDDGFGKRAFLGGIVALIDIFPTVKAVPVVHGKWIPDERGTYFCAECDSEAYWDTDYGQQLFDFCPYCGADMRKQPDGKTDKLIDAFCRTGRYESESLKQYGIDLSESFGNPEQVEIVPEEEWREIERRCKNESK